MSGTDMLNGIVLLVDDEPSNLKLMATILEPEGYRIAVASTAEDMMRQVNDLMPSMILLDLSLPDANSADLLPDIYELHPSIQIVIVTVEDDPEVIVRCMQSGAQDYLVKPINPVRLLTTVKRSMDSYIKSFEISHLQERLGNSELKDPAAFIDFVTQSPQMKRVLCYAENLARTDVPVLISGEKGTGKDCLVNALCRVTGQDAVRVDIEAKELNNPGVFKDIFFHGGTKEKQVLCVNDIADLSAGVQIMLLQFLKDESVSSAGRTKKFLFMTRENMNQICNLGLFSKELHHRLRAHWVHLPALREKQEDIEGLLLHFLQESAREMDKNIPTIPQQLIPLLLSYNFPGNARELKDMVKSAMMRHQKKMLSMQVFEDWIYRKRSGEELTGDDLIHLDADRRLPTLKELNRWIARTAMERSGGNIQQAANMLGITRQAMSKRLKNLDGENGED